MADNRWITVGDDGASLTMNSLGAESDGADFDEIFCVLKELEAPDSVTSLIESTRAHSTDDRLRRGTTSPHRGDTTPTTGSTLSSRSSAIEFYHRAPAGHTAYTPCSASSSGVASTASLERTAGQ